MWTVAFRRIAAVAGQGQISFWLEMSSADVLPVQAQESVAQRRPEVAQARGRALLNLRLRDAEGGLLGRTLLALVSNKVPTLLEPGSQHSINSC